MRKIFAACGTFLLMLLLIVSCTPQPTLPKEAVIPITAEEEAGALMPLLNAGQEVMAFQYHTEQAYTTLEVWVEAYEYGVLTEECVAGLTMYTDEVEPFEGKLAITLRTGDEMDWLIAATHGPGTASSSGTGPAIGNTEGMGRTYGPANGAVEIARDKEILLYISIYGEEGQTFSAYTDSQIYLEQPELLEPYPYVQMVKCRFS